MMTADGKLMHWHFHPRQNYINVANSSGPVMSVNSMSMTYSIVPEIQTCFCSMIARESGLQ